MNFGLSPASSVVVHSSTSITAISPTQSAGLVDVRVTTGGGTSSTSSADQYNFYDQPQVISVAPARGTTVGGTSVTISGSNFVSGSTTVKFGSTAATSLTFNSSSSLTAVSPAEGAATVNILVTTLGGTSGAVAADQFTYSLTADYHVAVTPKAGPTGGNTL